MENGQKLTAPYVSFSTFLTGIEALQQGVPEVLDKSVWRSSMNGTAQNHTMSAFRYFGLIDDDRRVQEKLKIIVHDKDNRKQRIHELLEESFPEIVALARNNGTVPQLNAAMERYGVKGTTIPKAITFFLKAAQYADLPISPNWKNLTRSRNGTGKGTRRSVANRGTAPKTPSESDTSERTAPPKKDDTTAPVFESRPFQLPGGDTLTVSVTRPFFNLQTQDRKFVSWLIDQIESYEAGGTQLDGRRETEETVVTPTAVATEEPAIELGPLSN